MESQPELTKTEIVDIADLQTDFISLRIGEEIPRLEIAKIRKIINNSKQDNLSGVDYKYLIDTKNGKLLKVNSWILWKHITAAIQKAGTINTTLNLVHSGIEQYTVKVI
ncbi:MAG: hypothetical protein KAR42_04745 [candidate division Zixibacteria bacterium]|nr:hypothetical protein [candidate division Zixibacteria bacterium]